MQTDTSPRRYSRFLSRLLIKLFFVCAAMIFSSVISIAATPPATWTTGHKKVLIIPVRFSDLPGPSDTPSANGTLSGWGNIANGTMTAQMSAFMAHQSYGKCTLEFTVLPEIDMGVSYLLYKQPLNSDSSLSKFTRWYAPGSIMDDIRARARQVGLLTANPALYDTDNYDLDIAATGFIPGQGEYAQGITYGKGLFASLFTALSHEIGHNLGLSHAWGCSRATYFAPLERGAYFENKYANVFDLMGNKDTHTLPLAPDRDAGVYWKCVLGWLPSANITTPAASGTYRLHPFDQGTLDAGKTYAIRIPRDPTHTYWLEYRQALTGADTRWTDNGLLINLGAESYEATAGNTYLIDTTPGSRGLRDEVFSTFHDAPLAPGRTYTDPEVDLHITTIQKGGTIPESLDVVINRGPFPSNIAPTLTLSPATVTVAAGTPQTFTATASDANGDTLAYYWEFDDPDEIAGVATGGSNADTRLATQGTHTWSRTGVYLVRCTVTDMKGGTACVSSQVTVTAGTPTILTISGTIKDENGVPLAGAIVNNGYFVTPTKVGDRAVLSNDSPDFAASGETAADGKYRIQLPYGAPGPHTYRLTVMYKGYSFTCSHNQGLSTEASVTVYSGSFSNINFTRVRANRSIAGSIAVAGRSYDPATDGALTISVAGQNIPASTGFWQLTVPDDTLVTPVATAANPAYDIQSSFSTPHRVVADFNGFYFAVRIPGKMPETGFTSAGATSDDTVGTVQIPISMTLPSGYTSWSKQQDFFYWIDSSSTAEYGVDYKMSGGQFSYYENKVPSPFVIPLKILPTGSPKTKTVVIKLGIGNSITNLSSISTFTYTIHNPDPNASYNGWLNNAFPGEENPAIIGDFADPDGDGKCNLIEFALGGDPASSSNPGLTRCMMQELVGVPGVEFTLVLAFRKGAVFTQQPDGSQKNLTAVDSIHLAVQGSVALAAFDQPVLHIGPSLAGPPGSGLPDLTGTDWEYHTFYLDPAVVSGRGFLRILVDNP